MVNKKQNKSNIGPLVGKKPRSRTKEGKWRKKRKDAGKKKKRN